MLLQQGRMCIKKYGRDAGSRAVIMAVEKDGDVKIISAGRPKERRCNPSHLEFLNEVIEVKDKEHVLKALGVQEKKQHAPKTEQAKPERKRA